MIWILSSLIYDPTSFTIAIFSQLLLRKAKKFVSFHFVDIQFFDILNFFGGAASLDSSLKAYKTNETKVLFH